MSWSARDAKGHTKKATTPKAKRAWAKTADAVLKRTGNEGQAVRVANSVVKKGRKK